MPLIFSPTTGKPADPADEQPNAEALGVSGAVKGPKGWRFSIVTDDSIIGTITQPLVKASKHHLHLGESEIAGYHAGRHLDGRGHGLKGRILVDGVGSRHAVNEVIGSEPVTREESAAFLANFFPQYSPTSKEAVVVRKDGTSSTGTGSIVDIHGNAAKAGAGLPVADTVLRTNRGGTIAIQVKTLSHTTSTKAERLAHTGGQVLDSLINEGRELILMVADRSADGYMTVAWYRVGAIVRMQAELCGDDWESGDFPLSAPDAGNGKMKRGGSPFYLKGKRGGTATGRIAQRRPLTFSLAGLRRFLGTLSDEERASVESPAAPFDPSFLPPFAGACIY